MALKFTNILKNIDLSKVTDVTSSITESIQNKIEQARTTPISESEESVIDSVDSLNGYLQSLQPEASPAVVMALQSQLQVLKYVQSPTMTLMVVDNIMVCLHKALKLAENDSVKESLKETFASLLQSFIFATEARLRYEVDSNREESIRLLSDAGDLLMSSVSSVATMVVPIAAGAKIARNLPKMDNVLASNVEQKSFLGRLILAKGKKELIEEKQQEFDKTLNYIFETLDTYHELVGSSIQLHGMLKRYADLLVERFAMTNYATVASRINKNEVSKLETLIDCSAHTVDAVIKRDIAGGIKGIFQLFTEVAKKPAEFDYNTVRNICRSLQSELEGYQAQIQQLDKYIADAEAEMAAASFLQFGRKKELQTTIDGYKQQQKTLNDQILDCNQRLNIVRDIIEPVNESIEQYSANLYRIVEKYKYHI